MWRASTLSPSRPAQPPAPCVHALPVVPYRPRAVRRTDRRGFHMNRVVVAGLLAAGALVSVAKAQDVPTIRVGWTIPAEESKYWMMRRPDRFPNLGRGYKIEWSQFQGTSPM